MPDTPTTPTTPTHEEIERANRRAREIVGLSERPMTDTPAAPTTPLGCGYFAPCEQDAGHDGPHTAGMYPEWQVPTIEPMAFIHPARASASLDVERLRQAFFNLNLAVQLPPSGLADGSLHPWEKFAAEYARLSRNKATP